MNGSYSAIKVPSFSTFLTPYGINSCRLKNETVDCIVVKIGLDIQSFIDSDANFDQRIESSSIVEFRFNEIFNYSQMHSIADYFLTMGSSLAYNKANGFRMGFGKK